MHPLDHNVLLQHSIFQAKSDCFVHALVGGVHLRLGFSRQINESKISPGFSVCRIHVVNMGKHFLSFIHMVEVVVGNSQVKEGEGFVEVLCTHQEHNSCIFPLFLFDVDLSSSLENKLILVLLSSKIADSNSLLVELKRLLELAKFMVTVTCFSVAAK